MSVHCFDLGRKTLFVAGSLKLKIKEPLRCRVEVTNNDLNCYALNFSPSRVSRRGLGVFGNVFFPACRKEYISLYFHLMSVKLKITEPDGIYFITITCFKWLPLFSIAYSYDAVYVLKLSKSCIKA